MGALEKIVETLEFYGDDTEPDLWGGEKWDLHGDGWSNAERRRFFEGLADCILDVIAEDMVPAWEMDPNCEGSLAFHCANVESELERYRRLYHSGRRNGN